MISKLPIQACISSLLLLNIGQSHAGWFADSMQISSIDENLWESRINNLKFIENNQQRHFSFNEEDLKLFERAFQNEHLIRDLNYGTNNPALLQATTLGAEQRSLYAQLSDKIDEMLYTLPPLEVESYTAKIMPESLFNRLSTGVVYHKKGYMQSYGGLHMAHDRLERLKQVGTDGKKVLIKIQGKNGRLFDNLSQRFEGHILWPKDSYFKIVTMDYNAEQDLHFLLLKEIKKPRKRAIEQSRAASSSSAKRKPCP
tara:strand:- start:1512 stop:2279 length:768 start_codon:yes stop_codon:yes gene_type:complete